MQKLVYANEKKLFLIALILSLIFWGLIIFSTKGIALAAIPAFFIVYLFVQSGFISHLKGTGALVSDKQFPDIQQRVTDCAQKVGLKVRPDVYILHGNGMFNAFATKFLRKDYIILLSDVLDALEDHPEAINFYIGHEMGHIDRKHLIYEPVLCLALILPLLGAAYSRAREYTCDLYGAACCSPEAAQKGLALLAVGTLRYKTINLEEYRGQTRETSRFWMSFHELIASYPWLVKRLARISPGFDTGRMPARNPLAYGLAIFVPRLNILSLVIIYALVIIMSGAFKAGELIEKAEQANQVSGEVTQEEYDSEQNPAVQTYQTPSLQDVLKEMADSIKNAPPEKIDDFTILNGGQVEGENAFVYNYQLIDTKENIDFAALHDSVSKSSYDLWCMDPSTQVYRDVRIKIIYRYVDQNNTHLGDVVTDTTTCPVTP